MTARAPDLSWIVPLYGNGSYAGEMIRRTHAAAEALGISSEIIFVDDHCPKGSGCLAGEALCENPAVNGQTLMLPFNHGQDAAIREGLRLCAAAHAMVLDGDLQDPPEMLSLLWPAMQRTQSDVVFAARHGAYESPDRLATSHLYRSTMEYIGGLPAKAGVCALLNQRAITSIRSTRVRRLSFLAALSAARLNCVSVPVKRDARADSHSAYSDWARLTRAVHSLLQTVRGRWLRIPL